MHRLVLCAIAAVFGASALSAQTPSQAAPPVPDLTKMPNAPKAPEAPPKDTGIDPGQLLRRYFQNDFQQETRVCSIPLLSVKIPDKVERMPSVLPPAPPGAIDRMPSVKLPAPPCEEKR